MTDDAIYLDHNATTPIAREVAEAMWPHLTEVFGNPSSTTAQGQRARKAVEHAREQLAALLGAHPDEIVFTSGGTEANNLAIRGAAALARTELAVTSAVEHPATTAPLAHLRRHRGWRVDQLPVDAQARIALDRMPPGEVGLGTLVLAHNETGTVQPVRGFAEEIRSRGGLAHADAAQAVGKIPVSVDELGVDLLSVAGHKFCAPKGVGALYLRRGTSIAPVLLGAGQEGGIRPGTENVPGIVALGSAAELAGTLLDAERVRQTRLRERLWDRLAARLPGLLRISPAEEALPNTLLVVVPGRVGAEVLAGAPGVAAATGSACHAGTRTPSAALLATGLDADLALGALRLSVGRGTTLAEVDRAADELANSARGPA
ncbi:MULTISPECIES: cysteine desulfurase family protein [unclassified Saccharopolyspora]|uniref:cysteine desulfurase family protein n=1 Tax=unclassified Saccharopolyspora TaxID=2646250 RepID=UPI001CD78797|nr:MULTISPECIES: cysteine desulfurase family protein [unclassified Saccharopolyspora]MCA1189117.1 cysteine desulfurase [Saccharopolyspora sp. 6T]MCA1191857.1 cysteine desulfurase [Saccharopolyspora sp. 6V]MCA1281589.1 cysteine desulfurase [Saccharopolyspora sp. 7B]